MIAAGAFQVRGRAALTGWTVPAAGEAGRGRSGKEPRMPIVTVQQGPREAGPKRELVEKVTADR
ncbi:hypothetical protein ATKI12_8526 [Kitasatospora sp. Ki12]